MKTINLTGMVGYEITAKSVKEMLPENSQERIQVFANSYGGDVYEAFEIYNIFKQYRGEVEFIINVAMSAMAYIVMSGNKIKAFRNSIFMAHKAWGGIIGNADEMISRAEIMSQMDNVQAEAFGTRIKKERSEILDLMGKEMWLIGWEPLAEAGVIDDVIDNVSEIEATPEQVEEIAASFARPITLAEAKLRLSQVKEKLKRDDEKMSSGAQRIAALFKETPKPAETTPPAQAAQSQDFTPAQSPDENKSRGVNSMSKLTDFLNANPEAKAEHEALLESAKAEGKAALAKASASLDEDRKRIAKILTIASAQLTPETIQALEQGTEPGEFAIAQMEKQKNLQSNAAANQGVFGSLVAKQTPGEQTQAAQLSDEEVKRKELEDFDAKARASAKKAHGKEV